MKKTTVRHKMIRPLLNVITVTFLLKFQQIGLHYPYIDITSGQICVLKKKEKKRLWCLIYIRCQNSGLILNNFGFRYYLGSLCFHEYKMVCEGGSVRKYMSFSFEWKVYSTFLFFLMSQLFETYLLPMSKPTYFD